MNKLIKKELQKVKIAKVPPFDDGTLELIIPKDGTIINSVDNTTTLVEAELIEGKYYDVEVEDYILRPFPGFTLKENWNRNIDIKDKRITMCILAINGKMVKFEGNGNETRTQYVDMWVPRKAMKILKAY